MKVKKLIVEINSFFNSKKDKKFEKALIKLENKKEKIEKKILNKEFENNSKELFESEILMIEDLIKKVKKKIKDK